MPKNGETLRASAKREFRQHPLSFAAGLAIVSVGVSRGSKRFEDAYHDIKDKWHDVRKERAANIAAIKLQESVELVLPEDLHPQEFIEWDADELQAELLDRK
jgi:hypothetical protein